MILTDEMLMAAFSYREAKLWEYLADSDVFAFKLSDGETGYCCVMGGGGEHLALGFYRGAKGFASYLKTLEISRMPQNNALEEALALDCINCDYMNSVDLYGFGKEEKERIREFAKSNGFKIRRPNGWPDFTRRSAYKIPSGVVDERDAMDITEALNAAVAVAKALEAGAWVKQGKSLLSAYGFDDKHRYPTKGGGKIVPFLVPCGDGDYKWSKTLLPSVSKEVFPKKKYSNTGVAARLKAMPHEGTIKCRFMHIPAPVKEVQDMYGYYSSVLLCVMEDGQGFLPVMPTVPVEVDSDPILDELAFALLKYKKCPAVIFVSDDKTKALLYDFCKKAGIKLDTVKDIDELDNVWDYMQMFFM